MKELDINTVEDFRKMLSSVNSQSDSQSPRSPEKTTSSEKSDKIDT